MAAVAAEDDDTQGDHRGRESSDDRDADRGDAPALRRAFLLA